MSIDIKQHVTTEKYNTEHQRGKRRLQSYHGELNYIIHGHSDSISTNGTPVEVPIVYLTSVLTYNMVLHQF